MHAQRLENDKTVYPRAFSYSRIYPVEFLNKVSELVTVVSVGKTCEYCSSTGCALGCTTLERILVEVITIERKTLLFSDESPSGHDNRYMVVHAQSQVRAC